MVQGVALSVMLFFGLYGGQHAQARRSASVKEAVVVPAAQAASDWQSGLKARVQQVLPGATAETLQDPQVIGTAIVTGALIIYLVQKATHRDEKPFAPSVYGSAAVQLSHNKAPNTTLVQGNERTLAAKPTAPVAAVVSILDKAPVPPPAESPVRRSPSSGGVASWATAQSELQNALKASATKAPASPLASAQQAANPALQQVKAQMWGPAVAQVQASEAAAKTQEPPAPPAPAPAAKPPARPAPSPSSSSGSSASWASAQAELHNLLKTSPGGITSPKPAAKAPAGPPARPSSGGSTSWATAQAELQNALKASATKAPASPLASAQQANPALQQVKAQMWGPAVAQVQASETAAKAQEPPAPPAPAPAAAPPARPAPSPKPSSGSSASWAEAQAELRNLLKTSPGGITAAATPAKPAAVAPSAKAPAAAAEAPARPSPSSSASPSWAAAEADRLLTLIKKGITGAAAVPPPQPAVAPAKPVAAPPAKAAEAPGAKAAPASPLVSAQQAANPALQQVKAQMWGPAVAQVQASETAAKTQEPARPSTSPSSGASPSWASAQSELLSLLKTSPGGITAAAAPPPTSGAIAARPPSTPPSPTQGSSSNNGTGGSSSNVKSSGSNSARDQAADFFDLFKSSPAELTRAATQAGQRDGASDGGASPKPSQAAPAPPAWPAKPQQQPQPPKPKVSRTYSSMDGDDEPGNPTPRLRRDGSVIFSSEFLAALPSKDGMTASQAAKPPAAPATSVKTAAPPPPPPPPQAAAASPPKAAAPPPPAPALPAAPSPAAALSHTVSSPQAGNKTLANMQARATPAAPAAESKSQGPPPPPPPPAAPSQTVSAGSQAGDKALSSTQASAPAKATAPTTLGQAKAAAPAKAPVATAADVGAKNKSLSSASLSSRSSAASLSSVDGIHPERGTKTVLSALVATSSADEMKAITSFVADGLMPAFGQLFKMAVQPPRKSD